MSKESRQDAEKFVGWLREHVSALYTEEAIDKLTDHFDIVWGRGFEDCKLQHFLDQTLDKSAD